MPKNKPNLTIQLIMAYTNESNKGTFMMPESIFSLWIIKFNNIIRFFFVFYSKKLKFNLVHVLCVIQISTIKMDRYILYIHSLEIYMIFFYFSFSFIHRQYFFKQKKWGRLCTNWNLSGIILISKFVNKSYWEIF